MLSEMDLMFSHPYRLCPVGWRAVKSNVKEPSSSQRHLIEVNAASELPDHDLLFARFRNGTRANHRAAFPTLDPQRAAPLSASSSQPDGNRDVLHCSADTAFQENPSMLRQVTMAECGMWEIPCGPRALRWVGIRCATAQLCRLCRGRHTRRSCPNWVKIPTVPQL